MTMNPGNKAKRANVRPKRRKIDTPRTFAKVSTAAALRPLNRFRTEVEVCKELGTWVNDPPTPQTVARMEALIAAFQAGIQKGFACAKSEEALEAIDNHLKKYGSQLSADDYKKFNDLGQKTWEGMVELGC